jgi:uncharacterized membrane protein
MEIADLALVLLRWLHIVTGLLFVGLLWWFNFVFAPFSLATDGETRKKVLLELLPRALYWFRWSALYTAVLGTGLLFAVFYEGGLTIEAQQPWSIGSYVMIAIVVLMYRLYVVLAKSVIGKDLRLFGAIGIVIVAALIYCMIEFGHFSYRGYVIHIGLLFGIIMVGNVWEIIWPGQKKILESLKSGSAPDPLIMDRVMQHSRHNTYLSVPLLWTMIEAHTAVPAANSWLYLIVVILIGWALVSLVYKKAGKLQG